MLYTAKTPKENDMTTPSTDDLKKLSDELLAKIASASDEAELESLRVAAIGKKGSVSELMKTLGKMSPEERQIMGPALNGLKNEIAEAIRSKASNLRDAAIDARLAAETIDVTLPLRPSPSISGRIHPLSQVTDELTAIFADMGFSIAEGPDVETDYYNFTALNFPEGHPAREMHDTFFMKPDANGDRKVLRTHTSPVQIRTMEAMRANEATKEDPIRIIIPGKTYRQDSDATHSPMFHQVEGLVVDKEVTIAHLRWTLEEFCKAFFEVENINMRFRPSFFPFTEPSLEVDIQCDRSGAEVKFGEGDDWMEILGCGMVHPNVLRNGGYDPDVYQGFAWGIGIDRIAMLKYGMPDLRAFFDADQKWLSHYGFRPLDMPTLFGGLSS
jgi:phenylalanyl-tRNA synthetase alpha chain